MSTSDINHNTSNAVVKRGAVPQKKVSSRSRKSGGGGSQELPAFVRKLWDMVDSPDTDQYIHWTPDGQSFEVTGRDEFEKIVLPKYFKHNNFSSFVRQLNMYGWHKVQDVTSGAMDAPQDIWRFQSPFFIKGRKDLLSHIVRNKGMKTSGSDDDEDIDLHRVMEELNIIKKNQMAIGDDLYRIKKDNEMLWNENLQSHERYKKHAETLERILRFLASLYGNQGKLLTDMISPKNPAQRLITAGTASSDIGEPGGPPLNFGIDSDDLNSFPDFSSLTNPASSNNNNLNTFNMNMNPIFNKSNDDVMNMDDDNDDNNHNFKSARIMSLPSDSGSPFGDGGVGAAGPGSSSSSRRISAISPNTSRTTTPGITASNSDRRTNNKPVATTSSVINKDDNGFPDLNDFISNSATPSDALALTPLRTTMSQGYDMSQNNPSKILYDFTTNKNNNALSATSSDLLHDKLIRTSNDIDRISRNIDSQENSLRHVQDLLQQHFPNNPISSPSNSSVAATGSPPPSGSGDFNLDDFLIDDKSNVSPFSPDNHETVAATFSGHPDLKRRRVEED